MRLEELRGRNIVEQNEMISSCQKLWLDDVINDPGKIAERIVVIRGNYADLNTTAQCVRIFEYLPEDKMWSIADMDLIDFEKNPVDIASSQMLKEKFKFFVQCMPGFLFEK